MANDGRSLMVGMPRTATSKHTDFVPRTGMVFGSWTLEAEFQRDALGWKWACRCVCGYRGIVNLYSLRDGGSKSCGCSRRRKPATVDKAWSALDILRRFIPWLPGSAADTKIEKWLYTAPYQLADAGSRRRREQKIQRQVIAFFCLANGESDPETSRRSGLSVRDVRRLNRVMAQKIEMQWLDFDIARGQVKTWNERLAWMAMRPPTAATCRSG